MCIAIWKPQKKKLLQEHLRNSWDNNPHGAGFMYPENGKIAVVKELADFDVFYKKYKYIEDDNLPVVLHFRLATHGKKDMDNCHPFLLSDGCGFVHNGIINGVGISSDKSDTYLFRDKLIQAGIEDIPNKVMSTIIKGFIGSNNKLIFLNKDGKVNIINDKAGEWSGGVWYSNTGYKSSYKNYSSNYSKRYWSWSDPELDDDNVHDTYPKAPALAARKSIHISNNHKLDRCEICGVQDRVALCSEYGGDVVESFYLCSRCSNLL